MRTVSLFLITTGLLGTVSQAAFAQGFQQPAPIPPVMPRPAVFVRPIPYVPYGFNWGYTGGFTGGFYGGRFGRTWVGNVGPAYPYSNWSPYLVTNPQPTFPALDRPQLVGAGGGTAAIVPEVPAELTIEFPTTPEIVVTGGTVSGEGMTRTFTSKAIRSGDSVTFGITAKWTLDGQQFEWKRTISLGSAERTRIVVLRGDPVQK